MNENHSLPEPDFAAFVGIDWADREHAVALRQADQERIEPGVVAQKPEALDDWALGLLRRFDGRPVAVAVELARGPLIYALMKYPHLVLYPLPPARLSHYRQSFVSSGAKDDPSDAQLILRYLCEHHAQLRPWQPDDPQTRRLRLLVEERRGFVDQRTACSNRLVACLKQYFPQALDWIGSHAYSRMACDFLLKWADLATLQRCRPQTIRKFYYAHNLRRGDVIEQRLEAIGKATPLTTDAAVIEVSAQSAQATARLLRQLVDIIAGFDQQIKAVFAAHADSPVFASLPGAGPALAPRLLCALGTDRQRFTDARELQILSGIAPVTKRSGRQCFVQRRWAAPKFLRQTFHEFAQHSLGFSVWAKAFYSLQIERGKGHHAAVRSLAFKWIRVIFACWQQHTPYDEARYMEQLQRRQAPLLAYLPAAGECAKPVD